jgi:chromosome segregation ATPase
VSEPVFPQLERISVGIPGRLRDRFQAFIQEKHWTAEEGVKILLAYGADRLTAPRLSPDLAQDEWSAARAELAVLRHRAYVADEAIRTLKLNITGLEATNRQFERSLAQQRARRAALRRELERMDGRARRALSPGASPDADDAPR